MTSTRGIPARRAALALTGLVGLVGMGLLGGCGGPSPRAASSDAPRDTPTTRSTPTTSSSPEGTGGLGLDSADHPPGTPLWAFTVPKGWKSTMLDEQGYNQAKGADSCQITTYQAKIRDRISSVRKGSEDLTRNYAEALQKRVPAAKLNGSGSMVFPGGTRSRPTDVEFTWAQVDYPQSGGQRFTSVIASRAFTSPDTALQMVYSCPTARIEDRETALRAMQRAGSVGFD